MREKDISVAVVYPGGRIDRMVDPLETTDMDVSVCPDNPYQYDIVLLDNAGLKIIKPIIFSKRSNSKVIYRIRGDMLRAFQEMNHTTFKYSVAKRLIGYVDGAISIEKVLAERFTRSTGVDPIGYAGIAKDPVEWPTVNHSERTLACITITNANYMGKIQPLIDYAPIVDEYLEDNGGRWDIFGKGRLSKYLTENIECYENIHYLGYSGDIKGELEGHNCMLHFSAFDSLPNAILEGFASNIPVITNPFSVFSLYGGPIEICSLAEIQSTLQKVEKPLWREIKGRQGMDYLRERHSKRRVGQQYYRFFRSILE